MLSETYRASSTRSPNPINTVPRPLLENAPFTAETIFVAQREHLRHERDVGRIHGRPVEWVVAQRLRVEGPQRLGGTDHVDEGFEQVELATRERVAVVDHTKVSLM